MTTKTKPCDLRDLQLQLMAGLDRILREADEARRIREELFDRIRQERKEEESEDRI